MKKHLKTIVLTILICTLSYLFYQVRSKINHKKEVAESIKSIPDFLYSNINGRKFSNQNLMKDKAVVFIYFNTECEYCNEEAQMIKENIAKLQNFHLIFISYEKPQIIKQFALKHRLTSYDNINFLYDKHVTFASTFDVNTLPCLVLYNQKQNLIEKIKGQVKIETLIRKIGTL